MVAMPLRRTITSEQNKWSYVVEHSRLYKNAEYSDVEFLLKDRNGNACTIPAHRLLLMSRSTVFGRMFSSDMEVGRRVDITDVSAEAFAEYLQFFYSVNVVLTSQNIGEVLKLIDKYKTPGFYSACDKFMLQSASESVAYEYYALVLSYDLPLEIKVKCEQILGLNRKLVFDTSNGVIDNRLIISNILQSDELDGDEMDIFRDVMAWVKASLKQLKKTLTPENIKQEMGDFMEHIRFPIMNSKDLLDCLKEYPSLLPEEDQREIMAYIAHGIPMSQANRFNTEKHLRSRVYNIAFELSNKKIDLTCGKVMLRCNEHIRRKYSIALKLDPTGLSNYKFNVIKNSSSVDISVTANSDDSWIDLGASILFDKPGDYVSIYVDCVGRYDFQQQHCGIGKQYSGIEKQHLPQGVIFHCAFPGHIMEIRLKAAK